MTDKKSSASRRKLLKSIAAGSGAIVAGKSLPGSWSRPVVDSVILPAHAQTSVETGPFAGSVTTNTGSLGTDSIFAKASDSLIPQAQAGLELEPIEQFPIRLLYEVYVCVTPNSSLDGATVLAQVGATLFTFQDVPLGGSVCIPDNQRAVCIRELPIDGVDAGGLLENIGLINDAHADLVAGEACCYLDSVTGTGAGRIEFTYDSTIDFDVGPNPCDMPDPCPVLD